MNFLAHLRLAGNDEGLMLGALAGDFVKGRAALGTFEPGLRRGIRLHRHLDSRVDALPACVALRGLFEPPYRRYAGLIADLAFDHELARHWTDYASEPLVDFDRRIWELVARRRNELPDGLLRFVDYAQRRGLFSAYADENEVLRSLAGLGQRLQRANPLHRLTGIWPRAREDCARTFRVIWPQAQSLVAAWLKRNSSSTGS